MIILLQISIVTLLIAIGHFLPHFDAKWDSRATVSSLNHKAYPYRLYNPTSLAQLPLKFTYQSDYGHLCDVNLRYWTDEGATLRGRPDGSRGVVEFRKSRIFPARI